MLITETSFRMTCSKWNMITTKKTIIFIKMYCFPIQLQQYLCQEYDSDLYNELNRDRKHVLIYCIWQHAHAAVSLPGGSLSLQNGASCVYQSIFILILAPVESCRVDLKYPSMYTMACMYSFSFNQLIHSFILNIPCLKKSKLSLTLRQQTGLQVVLMCSSVYSITTS